MFSIKRNSILQQNCSLNPRLVNRCVDKAIGKSVVDCFDKEPPLFRLCSQQPHISSVENVDVVRRELAFGNWSLPKLYKELHKKDPIVVLQAVNSVNDLVHDPEKMLSVIKLKFIPRLTGLIRRKSSYYSSSAAIKERVLVALETIGSQAIGMQAIFATSNLINTLKELLEEEEQQHLATLRFHTAKILEQLSRHFTGACNLIECGFIPILIECLLKQQQQQTDELNNDSDITLMDEYHLRTLEKLFAHLVGQEEALCYNATTINTLVTLLDCKKNSDEIVFRAGNCLAMLISHPEGKSRVDRALLVKLTHLLYHPNDLVYTSAAKVIMFATHTVDAKREAAKIAQLAERLLQLSNDFNHSAVQIFAIKALANMCEHPELRKKFLQEEYLEKVEAIRTCGIIELKTYKEILIKIIKWKPWIG